MADLFQIGDVSSLTESGSAIAGSALSTGDLRRKYNFGDRVSELANAQDPVSYTHLPLPTIYSV